MNNHEAFDRMKLLANAIAYSRAENKIMSIGEGIMCNQERAQLFQVLDEMIYEPAYTVPKKINDKVIEINNIIKQTRWKRPKIDF